MILVIVVQVKNIKNVVGLYKTKAKKKVTIIIETIVKIIFFLDLNISRNFVIGN